MPTRNLKFRLYPTRHQAVKLQNNLDACRWIYNRFVEDAQKGFLSRNDMNYILTELKQSESWLHKYHSKMLQMVSTKLDAAQKALNKLRKNGYRVGKIRFARYEQYRTFIYNQSGYKICRHGDKDLLWLSKIGHIEIRKHREITENVKQIIVSRSKSDKWYAIITCEIEVVLPEINFEKAVGLDVGIRNFVYDTNCQATPNPLNLEKILKPLARIQKKIARRQKGSSNRKKAIRWYQRIHERVANRRRDFHHNLSTYYAKNNDVVVIERLEKLNMVKNKRLSRKISDSGWGEFCGMLKYKCKMLIEVPSKNTTVDCSRCCTVIPKSLGVRIHMCHVCGLVMDRDHNASINILKKGLKRFGIVLDDVNLKLPQGLREFTPVEISKMSMNQEESIRSSIVVHKKQYVVWNN